MAVSIMSIRSNHSPKIVAELGIHREDSDCCTATWTLAFD